MRILLPVALFCLVEFQAASLFAQRGQRRKPAADTPSVVLIPESQKQVIDTTLLLPEEQKASRRRFRVRVVPAPPPGRSRQEILYSDSLGKMR